MRPRCTSRQEAESLVAGFRQTIADLALVLEEETAHLSAGRIRDGLACETRKGELAGRYLQTVEATKANAVALARFASDLLPALRREHALFQSVVVRNQTVLATARAVSEGLVKGVADEIARQTRPQGYGMPPPAGRPTAKPLVFSTRL